MDKPVDFIGRYRVVGTLGAGGFATVWLAEDTRLDALVAVKLLAPHLAAQEEVRERFTSEAQVLRRLAAPGLVAVHDIDEHDGCPFFVMEHCAGGSLEERLQSLGRPLPVGEAMALARAMRDATAGIHEAAVVHRDLKPANYLIRKTPNRSRREATAVLDEDEELVVGDFGLAKVVNADGTRATFAGGTPGYSAPEQALGDPTIDTRADVYALSAILVTAMTETAPKALFLLDECPFDEDTLAQTYELREPLCRGLDSERDNRQSDAMAWYATLETAVETSERATPTGDESVADPPIPERMSARGTRIATTFLALLIVLIVVAVQLNRPQLDVVGPTTGLIGDEVAFASAGTGSLSWTVNGGTPIQAQSIAFSPTEPGTYRVQISTGDRKSETIFTATPAESQLRIVGTSQIHVGQAVELQASAIEFGPFTWSVGGVEITGEGIEIQPAEAGLITVWLVASDGSSTFRTFTVSPL